MAGASAFVVEAPQVRDRIERVLRGGSAWEVVTLGERPVAGH